MRAERGFDPAGDLVDLPSPRRDRAVSALLEYGVTDSLALRLRGEWQSGDDAFVDYEGRGPLEIGVAWQAWRDERAAVSVRAGYAQGGEGRNAGYAQPGQGDGDWEVRVSAGRAFRVYEGGPDLFVEAQAARLWRQGLPDEARLDLTAGGRLGRDWLVMLQGFGGRTDGPGARWLSIEGTVVRDLGDWSVQAGWRSAVWGRETPEAQGPVVAIWRRF